MKTSISENEFKSITKALKPSAESLTVTRNKAAKAIGYKDSKSLLNQIRKESPREDEVPDVDWNSLAKEMHETINRDGFTVSIARESFTVKTHGLQESTGHPDLICYCPFGHQQYIAEYLKVYATAVVNEEIAFAKKEFPIRVETKNSQFDLEIHFFDGFLRFIIEPTTPSEVDVRVAEFLQEARKYIPDFSRFLQ